MIQHGDKPFLLNLFRLLTTMASSLTLQLILDLASAMVVRVHSLIAKVSHVLANTVNARYVQDRIRWWRVALKTLVIDSVRVHNAPTIDTGTSMAHFYWYVTVRPLQSFFIFGYATTHSNTTSETWKVIVLQRISLTDWALMISSAKRYVFNTKHFFTNLNGTQRIINAIAYSVSGNLEGMAQLHLALDMA